MGEDSAAFGSFVGRERELALVGRMLADARAGQGALVVVTGEAGIGKTRLCRQVAASARAAGFAVAWGSCWPQGGAPALWPWRSILESLGASDTDELFVAGAAANQEPFGRLEAIAERLAGLCRRTPALLVIDDVHFAGAGSLLLTRFVARALPAMAAVVIATQRTAGPETLAPSWDIECEATVVPLAPFDLDETHTFLRAHAVADDEGLSAAMFHLTGGHPLGLQRMVISGQPVEGGVRDAIEQAADQLSQPAERLLCAAAVLGGEIVTAQAAALSGVPEAKAATILSEAGSAGLVIVHDTQSFSFTHDLVREALLDRLPAHERADLHAGAASILAAARDPAQAVRVAGHAVRAAERSPADARKAVAACRRASQTLLERFDYEQAASVLGQAVSVCERMPRRDGSAPLVAAVLVEWAEAILRCGRLAEAREVFSRAAKQAEGSGDRVLLARAALGLGGVWINEHRGRLDWESVVGLQRRALHALPEDEVVLRQRLCMRLAAEQVYRGGPIEPVLAALEQARALGDPLALAEALSLTHHALLTPRHTRRCLELADELIAVACAGGQEILALIGLCWRTVDLFHLGDPRAVRCLRELRDRAELAGCLSVCYIAEAMEVMLLIRSGNLDEAETKAYQCFQLGQTVGDADAQGFLAAHLTTIRWLQGRDAELLADIAGTVDSPTLNPAEFAFQTTLASIAARLGHHEQARDVLARLGEAGLAALPESSTWLGGMLGIVDTAYHLGDGALARQAYELLLPYADVPITPSLAVTCFGSAHRALGLAALTFGEPARASAHFEDAVRANRLLGHHPLVAITLADLAESLSRTRNRHDRQRAVRLLSEAQQQAQRLGMTVWAGKWRTRAGELATQEGTITHQGRHWVLTLGEQRAVVADRLGVRYLATLLSHPYRSIKVLELVGAQEFDVAATQPVLDERARTAYRRRIAELTEALADTRAGARADTVTTKQRRQELRALVEHLRQATGTLGRSRGFPDPHERARTAVRKAIKRAIDEIGVADPDLGAFLAAAVTTGGTCRYSPPEDRPVQWSVT